MDINTDLGVQVNNDIVIFKGSDTKSSQWGKTKLNLCDGKYPGLVALERPSTKGATHTLYPADTSKLLTINTLVAHLSVKNTVAYVHHSLVFPYLADLVGADQDALWSKPEHAHRRMWLLEDDFQAAGGVASAFDMAFDEFKPLKKQQPKKA